MSDLKKLCQWVVVTTDMGKSDDGQRAGVRFSVEECAEMGAIAKRVLGECETEDVVERAVVEVLRRLKEQAAASEK